MDAYHPPDGRHGASPPRASRPHRAHLFAPCEVPRTVRRYKRAPRVQPRTSARNAHRATRANRAPARERRTVRAGAYPRVRANRRLSAPFSSATSSPTANTSVPKHSTCGGIPAFAAPYTNRGKVTAGPATNEVIT